jgi:hypothetical protein
MMNFTDVDRCHQQHVRNLCFNVTIPFSHYVERRGDVIDRNIKYSVGRPGVNITIVRGQKTSLHYI